MTSDSETFDDVALDEQGNAAFRLATRGRTGVEPLQTADLLGALARTDAHGTWERIWLATEVWEFAEGRPRRTVIRGRSRPSAPAAPVSRHRDRGGVRRGGT